MIKLQNCLVELSTSTLRIELPLDTFLL